MSATEPDLREELAVCYPKNTAVFVPLARAAAAMRRLGGFDVGQAHLKLLAVGRERNQRVRVVDVNHFHLSDQGSGGGGRCGGCACSRGVSSGRPALVPQSVAQRASRVVDPPGCAGELQPSLSSSNQW